MITLYRGDDTTFKGVKRLRVTIESKESLAGCSATFEVCGVVKHVPDVSTGSFWLALTGEDTARMPLGTHAATLRVWDAESRRRTVSNTIMVCVTERIGDAYPGEEEVAVSLGAMVEWRNVSGKPSINGVVLEGDKTTRDLGIRGVAEATLVDLPEDYTPDVLREAVNAINACLRASMACLVAAACALLAPCAAQADEADATGGGAGGAGRVVVRELGDMTSMSKQFNALSNITRVVTSVSLDGLATEEQVASATGTLARAVADAVARGTNYVTRAEVVPEYNEDGTPSGKAARAADADRSERAATANVADAACEAQELISPPQTEIGVDSDYSVISQLDGGWNVAYHRASDGVDYESELFPDGSPFMTSNAVAKALRGEIAQKADKRDVYTKTETQNLVDETANFVAEDKVSAAIFDHESRHDNPHKVTASQVDAYTKEEADEAAANVARDEIASYLHIAAQNPANAPSFTKALHAAGLATTNDVVAATNGLLRAESDPTVPAWAKAATKPTYTASDIGAIPAETFSRMEGTVVAGGNTFDVRSKSCEASGRVATDVPWEYRKALYGGGEIWLRISDGAHPGTYATLAEYTWHFQTIYSLNGKHSTRPYLHHETTGTNYYFSGEVKTVSLPLEVSVRKILSPTVALTAAQEARGVTYVKNGLDQNCAIAIGTNAVASVDPAYVAGAPSNAILRSVSVAIGGNADARGDGTGTSQGVAIGWWAQAKAGNAIAIGTGAQHTNETAMSGNATVASAACAVALGYSAKATAPSAVQIGFGTNATPHSLQFEGVQIVRDGRLVAAGVETGDVMRVVGEMLRPRTYGDLTDDVIEVRSHTLTVLAPTNGPCDEVELAPTLSRNYEVFLANVPAMRESLPLSFDTAEEGVAKLGAWWGRKLVRLPAKVSVKSPSEDIAILEVEPYDDGWDWTPAVTGATFAVTGGVVRLETVLGVNLHAVTEVTVSYVGADGTTNAVTSTAVRNPLYGKVEPEIAAIPQGDVAGGAGVTVTASGETGSCAFPANPLAAEEVGR